VGNRPYYEIEIDRNRIARYGINVATIQDVIAMAIGGMNVTQVLEGRERYPIRVRYMREMRDSPDAMNRIFIPAPGGEHIPLGMLVNAKRVLGPAMIQSENTMPYVRIFINVNQEIIGLVDFVRLAQRTVEEKIRSDDLKIPAGYYIQWSGQFESEMEARNRIAVVLPICLMIILLLLYIAFKDVKSVLILSIGLPLSLAGGIIPLFLFGFKFSTAVWVGFISLFGIATDNAIVLLSCFKDLFTERKPGTVDGVRATILEGGLLRVRPIMMTVFTTIFALVPIMFFTSAGSEVIKPMALPVIGGLISATFANLVLVPILYSWTKERQLNKKQ